MGRILPSSHLLGRLIALAGLAFAAGVWLRAEDGPEVEIIKQLAFIEQHLAEPGVVDGIESPYDVLVSPDGAHVYVASLRNDAIAHFARDAESGELSYGGYISDVEIGQAALDGARSLTISPNGNYLYAVSMFANCLSTFARNTTDGSLSFVGALYDGQAGIDGLLEARSLVMSPDGKHLYVAAFEDDKLSVYSRSGVNGAATFLGVYQEGDQGVEELTEPHALAISPDGLHLYVALWSNQIVIFSRDVATGLLTFVAEQSYLQAEIKKDSNRSIALSPDGKFVYVASANNDAISVFSRDSGTGELTGVEDIFDKRTSANDLDGPHDLTISADGKYLYAAVFSSDAVTTFERNADTGKLAFYQSIGSESGDGLDLNGPISIGASPDGEHVYVGSGSGTHSVVTFRREILVDPPELVVEPVDRSIEEGESVAFHALAQGVDLSYQWLRDGEPLSGETLPVLTIDAVVSEDDGSSFQIRVSNPGGALTSEAVTLSVLPPIVVDAPADLTALDISSSSAKLAWADASDNETNFEIQRRSLGGDFSTLATVLADEIQYIDPSLSASTTYIYRVRAKRNDTVSLWSNDAVIESFDDVPQTPVNLDVEEETYNKVSLKWSDRSAVEDGFRILRRKDELGAIWKTAGTADKNATRFEDRGVEPLSTYAYRVQAYNESGSSEYSNSVVALTGSIPVEAISPFSRSIPKDAIGGYTISVTSEKDWEALPTVDWLIVTSPQNGDGSGSQGVVYRSRLNESQDERVGKIVVGGLEHTVVQAGSPPFLRIKPSRTEVIADGGSKLVNVESNVDWSVDLDSDWVSISSGQEGSDYGTVTLSVAPNPDFTTRIAELVINSQVHVIEQAGQIEALETSASRTRFDAEGGSGVLAIESNVAWSVGAEAEWIGFSGDASGEGAGTLDYSVAANDTGELRSADIRVNDRAITIVQEAPVVAEIAAPQWVRVTVGNLGAELEWIDQSEDESGFRIRRSVEGSGIDVQVAEVDADVTVFFDRGAPRGARVEYTLVAFNEDGESEAVSTLSEALPSSNFVSAALKVTANPESGLFLAEIPVAGSGQVQLERRGFGETFESLNFGCRYPSATYSVDCRSNAFALQAEATAGDFERRFGFESLWNAAGGFGNGVTYSAQSVGEGGAYSRGGRALGHVSPDCPFILFGFEIEGEADLPVLIQGIGKSLERKSIGDAAAGVKVTLYAVDDGGTLSQLGESADWREAQNSSGILVEDAIGKTKATSSLAEGGGEARMLVALDQGRYLVALESLDGSNGSVMLEVFDAR